MALFYCGFGEFSKEFLDGPYGFRSKRGSIPPNETRSRSIVLQYD
jgi:hypothetical protein